MPVVSAQNLLFEGFLFTQLSGWHHLRDPQLQRDVHRSQNRIESYHQLRAAIAQVNGKKTTWWKNRYRY